MQPLLLPLLLLLLLRLQAPPSFCCHLEQQRQS
jgi:hypothetical protein